MDLVVDYAEVTVVGCRARLRTYNGSIIGPTILAAPGDTLHIRLINRLLPDRPVLHPQQPPPPMHADHFSFNVTNLHTHGLHVPPQGSGPVDPRTGRRKFESDNVLIELQPGEFQDYRIEIPTDHAAGTFWYHAHVHGATAVQVSSGMAGALIIESGEARHGDLSAVPEIAAAAEKTMVFQQIWVDENGEIEELPSNEWPTLVNGQLVPQIKMRPGEVQRWRFIHAGVKENLALSLEGHDLNEVAADGISLGRSIPWPAFAATGAVGREESLFLGPGYRADVLIKISEDAEHGEAFYLRQHRLAPDDSIQVANARIDAAVLEARGLLADVAPEDLAIGEQVLVEVLVVDDDHPVATALPDDEALSGVVPAELVDITDEEISRTLAGDPDASRSVTFGIGFKKCDEATGDCSATCMPGEDGCDVRFMVNQRQFTMDNGIKPLSLKTDGEWTAAEWTVASEGFTPLNPSSHPFHIHVNPFQVQRIEPDGVMRWRWKDTWLTLSDGTPRKLRMRYRVFTGKFVLHCHILDHEDKGMMAVVEIVE